jgi:hypothetical protein
LSRSQTQYRWPRVRGTPPRAPATPWRAYEPAEIGCRVCLARCSRSRLSRVEHGVPDFREIRGDRPKRREWRVRDGARVSREKVKAIVDDKKRIVKRNSRTSRITRS